jgi:peptide/nickel transport system substrate-binding protein
MRSRVLIPILVFAVIAGLGFAMGTKPPSGGDASTGAPTYGGTLTQLHLYNMSSNEPPDWDPVKAAGPQVITYSQLIMEQALEGDIEKFGPRGNKTYGFTNPSWVDEPFYKGNLVESWTWTDPLTLTFKVRKGIMYSGISANPGVMKAREFVASDFVYHLTRMKTSASKGQLWDWVAETSAPDKYTWVVKFKQYYADWSWWLASAFMQIYPKEVVEAPGGASDWKNLVGTGPFTLTEYVRGSHTTYTRNPTYWGRATIGGKEYKLPFIEKLVWPMITDESTQIASLRTGKVDWAYNISPKYADTLTKTSAELKRFPYLNPGSLVVALQCSTSAYFKNENVRRALMIATDMATIGKNAWGAGNYDINPLTKGSALFVPVESMPASTKELFTYDIAKAKKMLADAGYPNGFKMEMAYDPSLAIYKSEDIASMIVDMWSKVGVTVTLKPVESAVYTKRVYDHTYTDSILCGRAFMAAGVSMAMGVKGHEENTGAWVNDEYTKAYEQAFAERDATKSLAIKKDIVIKFLDSASMIPTPVYTTDCYAWSWVKNYYGEISAGFMGHNPMLKLMWIDQAQKKKLGF